VFDARDPRRYFQTFTNTVDSCKHIKTKTMEGPHALPSWEDWTLLTMQMKCKFYSGERLEVIEDYVRKSPTNPILINQAYQFMESSGRDLIFRIDTHGQLVPPTESCHIHIGAGTDRIQDGDHRLNGFALQGINFPKVFHLIFEYLEDRKFPWDI
jgi:hypothetical protein